MCAPGAQLGWGFVGYVTNPLDIMETRLMPSAFAAGSCLQPPRAAAPAHTASPAR